MKYQRMRDLQRTMQRLVGRDSLIRALFEEIPELQRFTWVKTQEYDDNNYFDDIRVKSINGHPVGWDGYEDEDEGDLWREGSTLPRIPQIHMVNDLVNAIADDYEFRDNEIEMSREDYVGTEDLPVGKDEGDKMEYFLAQLGGVRLPDGFFVGKDPGLAVYHAIDHGRIGNEADVFAVRGCMSSVLDYARVVGGRIAPEVENFYVLDNHEHDRESLKTYLEEFCRK